MVSGMNRGIDCCFMLIPLSAGLCFSVRSNVKTPPSLKNIYKEIKTDYPDFVAPTHGSVEPGLHFSWPFALTRCPSADTWHLGLDRVCFCSTPL